MTDDSKGPEDLVGDERKHCEAVAELYLRRIRHASDDEEMILADLIERERVDLLARAEAAEARADMAERVCGTRRRSL